MKTVTTERHEYETDNNVHRIVFDRGAIQLDIGVGPSGVDIARVEFPAGPSPEDSSWTRLKQLSEFLADVVANHEKTRREAFKKRHR